MEEELKEVIFSLSKGGECELQCDYETACQDPSTMAREYEVFRYDCTYGFYFDEALLRPLSKPMGYEINCGQFNLPIFWSKPEGPFRDVCCQLGGADLLWKPKGSGEVEINAMWNNFYGVFSCGSVEIENVQNVSFDWLLIYGGSGTPLFTGDFDPCGVSKFTFNPLLTFLNRGCEFINSVGGGRYIPYMGSTTYNSETNKYTYTPPDKIPDYLSIWIRPKYCEALPLSGNGFDCPVGSCSTRTLAIGTQCIITGAGCGPDGGTCARNDPNDRSSECGCQASPNYLKIIHEFEWKGESPP